MDEQSDNAEAPVEAKVNMDVVKSKRVSVKRQFQGKSSAGIPIQGVCTAHNDASDNNEMSRSLARTEHYFCQLYRRGKRQ